MTADAAGSESGPEDGESSGVDVLGPFRQFMSFRRDVLVLSVAMFAFSLGFQMTGRYVPYYIEVLGGSAVIAGHFGSLGNLIGAVYPYVGGTISDRIGSRYALTLFGTVTTIGFLIWFAAPMLPGFWIAGPWIWVFVGLFLTQAWKSFGLGATFAIVKQSTDPKHLAMGFASTEVFRRIGFLVGPALAGAVFSVAAFGAGFRIIALLAVAFGVLGTVTQHYLYDASADSIGSSFEGVDRILDDLRDLPGTLKPLLVADTLIRFANGMVYFLFVYWVIDHGIGFAAFGFALEPRAYFGALLSIEMVVALISMPIVSKLAEYSGLKPVVAIGFAVYATFPIALVLAPETSLVYLALFAFSGLRFAGLPAHKALIVGPAERDTGGRVTGTYYLIRNTIVVPSAAIGGWLYDGEWTVTVGEFVLKAGPELAFTLGSVVGVVGVLYFLAFGEEFEAYA